MWFAILITALTAYLLGNLNGSVCISALMEDDVRKHGSGNAGLTNFFRNYGFAGTGLVLLTDMIKTVLACFAGGLILEPFGYGYEGRMLGAVAVSLGHDCPILLGFKGGKGVASSFGVLLMTSPVTAAIVFVFEIVTIALTKTVSVASIGAALINIVLSCFLLRGESVSFVCSVLLSCMLIFCHRANIGRLIRKEENKLDFKKISKLRKDGRNA